MNEVLYSCLLLYFESINNVGASAEIKNKASNLHPEFPNTEGREEEQLCAALSPFNQAFPADCGQAEEPCAGFPVSEAILGISCQQGRATCFPRVPSRGDLGWLLLCAISELPLACPACHRGAPAGAHRCLFW